MGAPPLRPRTEAVVLVVEGPVERADIPRLCERARALMDRGAIEVVICDVSRLVRPDGVTLDALARLQLAARRRGAGVVLRGASPDLLALLALAGLSEVVPPAD